MTANHTSATTSGTERRHRWATRVGLLAILLLAAYLRFLSLIAWDEPSSRLHPDERFFTDVASMLQVPSSFDEYLDSTRNPLNPRNYTKNNWYVYGLLPQTLTQYTAVMLTPQSALPTCVNRPEYSDPAVKIGRPCQDTSDGNYATKIENPDRSVPKLALLQPLLNHEGRDLTGYYEIFTIGRTWSALFDLGSVLLVFLIGTRLYRRRAGLLAALLYACAVLPIQLAHFFTVDAATGFFVLATVYWAVRCAQNGGLPSFSMLGLSIGAAMACRVTLATLGLLGILAVAARLFAPTAAEGQVTDRRLLSARRLWALLGLLAGAGALALITFRLLQPDAFRGTSFFDIRPDERFIENIARISGYVSGEADSPPQQQWAGRVPYLFPLQNMVLWGLGLPLGLAALAAWVVAGWQLVRRRNLVHLIPWAWVTFYFAWQGGQFVTTMRYYSSLYGLLCVLVGWALVRIVDSRLQSADSRLQSADWRKKPTIYNLRSAIYVVPLITVIAGTAMWAFAFTRIYTHPHSRVEASRWIYQNIPAGSTITAEVWDDALPLYLDGRDASQYIGLPLQPYAEDEPSKYFGFTDNDGVPQPGLLDQLDQADYLIFSSNRVYDSTRRLPMKYPALMRYWNALFENRLGFTLVADIHSYPTLFGIEIPTPVLAEEAFSVYDHPRVLIFQKTPAYSRANAEAQITDGVAWEEVYKVTSFVGGKAPSALRLTGDQWPPYRDGGATILPSLFGSLAPWLAWLLVLELIGFAAFALLFHALPGLADRGFALSKTLGLLVVAWLAWLLASLGANDGQPLLSFSPLSVWLCTAVLGVPGAVVGWRSRVQLQAFFREQRAALLTAEGLFLAAFFGFLVIRALNPDLWHDARGGEKPMDLAFLTATLKSAAFPPYDPWFAGGYINYYYFGFVFVGTLVHLSGVAPTVAYNLAVPTIFALTALGAFGVGFNLLARRTPHTSRPISHAPRRRAIAAGLAAALFVTTLGPLTQAVWFLPGTADATDMGISEECRLESSYAAQQTCRGRSEWAFWDATRAVGMAISKSSGGNDSTISEFPFFTFLFADMHAHMLALPLALCALGLIVAVQESGTKRGVRGQGSGVRGQGSVGFAVSLGLLALVVGALAATNTWDYPTYLALGVLALGLVFWRRWQAGEPLLRALVQWALWAAALVALSRVLFLPFHQHFATEYVGFELWRGERTGAGEFLKINGLWLFLLLAALLAMYRRQRATSLITLALVGAVAVLICTATALLGLPAVWLIVPMLGVAIGTLLDMLFHQRRAGEPLPSMATLLPTLWACAALGICFLSEMVVAKGDIGRMNTVFKLGMQSWTLFGIASAVAFTSLFLPQKTGRQVRFSSPVAATLTVRMAAIVLVLAGLVYPLTATPARIADRFDRTIAPTLDGTAYMSSPNARWGENNQTFSFAEDADALEWMRRSITGTPVVLEAQSEGYRWAGRVSIYTGLPTVLGWPWHETQQRSATRVQPVLDSRRNLVPQLYTDADEQATLTKLRQYGVEYVYVGQLERALYGPVAPEKFARMAASGAIQQVYQAGQTSIYQVPSPQAPPQTVTTALPVIAPTLPPTKNAMLDRPVGMLPAVNEYAWNDLAQSEPVAILLWLLAIGGVALLGLPLSVVVFGRWRDGGVTFAPLVGLLLLGYAVWLPVSAGLWQYDRLGVALGTGLVLALNAVLLWLLPRNHQRTTDNGQPTTDNQQNGFQLLAAHSRAHARQIALVAGVWLLGFLALAFIRTLNPDLWQSQWGGEKPFEFGFLNAILRSPVMPPYNPFYSDGTINYYYYGLYLLSLPIKITGIAPAVGFNLALATLYAMTLAGAFTIVRQLTGRVHYGVIGAIFVALAGNLAAVFTTEGSWSAGLAAVRDALTPGLAGLGVRLDAWFIGPSRVIPYTINEFPFWSFLFADLHPHLIALPITLLAIALAWTMFDKRGVGAVASVSGARWAWGLAALVLGALAVTNSWDFPSYMLLITAALAGAVWLDRGVRGWALAMRLLGALALAAAIGGAGLVLYLPFFQNFTAMVGGIGLVRGGTMPQSYAVIYGLFLSVLLPGLALLLWRFIRGAARRTIQPAGIPAGALGIVARANVPTWALAVVPPLLLLGLVAGAALNHTDPLALKLALGTAFVACVLLLLRRGSAPATWFALLLAALGFAVSIGIDTVYIRDHLAGDPANPGDWYRMNTVFKFGMQIWTLLALASAALLPVLLHRLRRIHVVAEMAVGTLIMGVAALALVFPLFGIPSRVAYRFPVNPEPTLDGLKFLDTATYDWNGNQISLRDDGEAIRWLNDMIEGTPVVLQSSMEFYRAYGVRIAANTGLPTVVSPLHESEQRDGALVAARDQDVIDFYRTTNPDEALRILSKYRVGYVYVGQIERAAYGEAGMAKFKQLVGQYLTPVFSNASITIYKVDDAVYRTAASNTNGAEVVTINPAPLDPQPADPQPNDPVLADPPGEPTLAELEAQNTAAPGDSGPAFSLGQRYRDLSRYDDAARVLAVAAAANPGDVALHHIWGDTLRDAGRFDDAEFAYTLAAQAQPTSDNYNKLGTELLVMGKLEAAEIALNEALRLDGQAAEPYFRLGQLYEQQQKREQAQQNYTRYLELEPGGPYSAEAKAGAAR